MDTWAYTKITQIDIQANTKLTINETGAFSKTLQIDTKTIGTPTGKQNIAIDVSREIG